MTHSTDSTYLLGETSGEHGRLIRQAHIFGPFTERLFREAGVDTGQRVLDVGSGVGDVALLAARLVGPSGTVIGVERDPNTVATASSRASAAGLVHRLRQMVQRRCRLRAGINPRVPVAETPPS